MKIKLFLTLIALLLSGCGVLKAKPVPESELVRRTVESAHLTPDNQGLFPFHHTWDSGQCGAAAQVYVKEVDTSRLDSASLAKRGLSAKDVEKLAQYAHDRVERAFSNRSKQFEVVQQHPVQGRVIELSLVELTTTDVFRNVLATVVGAVLPGGGLLSIRSSGTIGIEGVVRDASSGTPLFVFADRERGKTTLFSFNDFRLLSHARSAIDDWAKQLVAACAATPGTKVADSSPITLSPI